MTIELIKPWGVSGVGQVLININKPVADILIKRKIAVLVKPKKKAKKKAKNNDS